LACERFPLNEEEVPKALRVQQAVIVDVAAGDVEDVGEVGCVQIGVWASARRRVEVSRWLTGVPSASISAPGIFQFLSSSEFVWRH
jgi:hypothetical protein